VLNEIHEVAHLMARVKTLEDTVRSLRVSRRVLMNLMAERERSHEGRIRDLERKNKRLRRDNRRYAQRMLEQNIRLMGMENPASSDGRR
jgi:hypothetical protein